MVGSPLTRDWALFSCDSEQGHSAPPSWTAGWALTCSFWATEGPWRTASTRLDRQERSSAASLSIPWKRDILGPTNPEKCTFPLATPIPTALKQQLPGHEGP